MASEKPFIGQMDKIIEVYKVELVKDELGQPKETDVLVAEPWAKQDDISGTIAVEGGVVSVVNRTYTIRRNPVIAKDGLQMIVIHNGIRFLIDAIKEIGRTHLILIVKANE